MAHLDHALPARPEPSFVFSRTTVMSWLWTTDHKRIGVLYFVGTALMLLLGGLLAMALRLEHLTPGPTVMGAMAYNRAFTLHGVIMVFLFMIPAIPGAFGNFMLPLMIGADDLAFPRINIASFWVYLAGGALVMVSVAGGGIDTGWTFYAPYSTESPTAVTVAVLGVFLVGVSSIMTGVNFVTTTHMLRAPGVSWRRLPLFVWTIYGTSLIQILATPVLGTALLLTAVDHFLGWGVFDPVRGGDPLLFQHLFWFYSHPAVYIMILPAMGVVSEVVCTFAHRRPPSYALIAGSTLGIAFVGFLTWGHHMFVAGMSEAAAGAFGLLSMLVAIFSAIKVYAWVGTLYRGRIDLKTPLLYVLVFLFLFVFGGMTGVAVATTSLDVHWHDTYFVVAHFHFIMVGGTLTAYLSAIHYWFPKVTGRLYSERWGAVGCSLVAAGFVGTFTPQFLLGNAGMPRRYYHYDAGFQPLNVISTVGSWALFAGLGLTAVYLLVALFRGPRAAENPWGSLSFEWRTASPPPEGDYEGQGPSYERGPYDYGESGESGEAGEP